MKVLIADDSLLILERLQEMVVSYNQAEIVGVVKNGNDTLDALRIHKPDLAIVDIKMPGLSGLEVLSIVRKEKLDVKFVILTFYSSEQYRQMAIQSGADYFFNKVDDFDSVSMVVASMIMKEMNERNMSN
jgi:DNA-binding NarL/FixJ family response regulator